MIKYNFYSRAKEIDWILKENIITDKIFTLIKEKPLEDYFFKKARSIDWFFKLKKRGYFSPERVPRPRRDRKGLYQIPQWNILYYLEEISLQTKKAENEVYIAELLKIMERVTKFHIKNNNVLDNYRLWWFFVKILLNIPNEKIPVRIVNLVPIWLDSRFDVTLHGADIAMKLLPKFLNSDNSEDWDKAKKLFEFISDIKWIPIPKERRGFFESRKKEPKTLLDPHWLLKSLRKHSSELGEKCSRDIIFTLANRLTEIFREEYPKKINTDFSNYWFSSLFSEPSISTHETKEVLTVALRDFTLAKSKKDISSGRYILNIFLKKYSYPLFLRLVLFVIANEWKKYKKIFWDLLMVDDGNILLNRNEFTPEIYKLLELNIKKFTAKEKKAIRNLIEKGPTKIEPAQEREKIVAIWKQKWYSALISDKDFNMLHEEQMKITQKEIDVESKRVEVKFGEGPSPISKDVILKMSNTDIAKYLETFKEKDKWEGPTIGGLAAVLKSSVQERPEKFIDDLNPFFNLGYLYVYEILQGIKEGWKEKKSINWGKLCNFIKKYINRDEFWKDKYIVGGDDWPAKHSFITGMIGELIQESTTDNKLAISEKYFDDAREILFEILRKEKVEQEQIIKDHVTFALNSVHGKVISAIIYLALLIARIQSEKGSKKEVKWPLEFKRKYDLLLKNGITESYILFGQYLTHLNYLDKEWVKSKIHSFVNLKDKNLWEAFMSGYLFNRIVYKNLYNIMRNHYLRAIDFHFIDDYSKEQLVQHISLGYLQGDEDFSEKSLFGKLLKKWELFQIKEIIRYFSMQQEHLLEDKKSGNRIMEETQKTESKRKIIEFWRWMYNEKYKGKKNLKKEDKEILSELSKLIIFLNKINSESRKWLLKSAPYINVNFNSPYFIECLDRLKDKDEQTTRFIGEIFLKALKDFTPDYDKDHIRSIVDYLYKSCNKDNADRICNIYGSRGYDDLLRDIYEKYHNKEDLCMK